jgi:hypothetical protein
MNPAQIIGADRLPLRAIDKLRKSVGMSKSAPWQAIRVSRLYRPALSQRLQWSLPEPCTRFRLIGRGVRIDAFHPPRQLPHFNRWMLPARGTGDGDSVAVGRTIYELRLNNVIIAPDEK